MKDANEVFEKYWEKRQYKHPEEKKKEKKIAKKFYCTGFHAGAFYQRMDEKELGLK